MSLEEVETFAAADVLDSDVWPEPVDVVTAGARMPLPGGGPRGRGRYTLARSGPGGRTTPLGACQEIDAGPKKPRIRAFGTRVQADQRS
jgi:hypothetical protein